VLFLDGLARPFGTIQNTAQHIKFWTVPAWHEYENRVVPSISAQWAIWHGPHFKLCLDRNGTKITHRLARSLLFYYHSSSCFLINSHHRKKDSFKKIT
jgi:hypothetical protein